MSEYHDLVQALTWLITHRLQARGEYTRGLLGDGQGHVQVPGRDDFTYVRPDRYTTRTFEVFNKTVSGPDGMPVILGELPWQPGLTQVLDVDWETYYGVGWGGATPGGRLHGPTHEWPDAAPGIDTFNVYTRQIAPLRTYPVGSGSTAVYVSSYNFNHLGDIKSWPGIAGTNLAAAIPSSTGTARFVLTYWDPASGTSGYVGVATGTLGVDAGSEVLNRPAPPAGTIPSAWVRLAGGQGSVTEFDIWDARMPWMPSIEFGTGSGAIHAGLIPISDVGGYYTGSTVEAALEEAAASGGGPPSGAAGGDLTGTYPNPQVAGLRGFIVDGEAPTEGYLLTYTGSAWRPRPAPVFPGSALPTGPAGGDLTGSYPDPLVAGLFGYSLLNNAPSEGDVLMFTGSAWQPIPRPVTADAWAFVVKNTSGGVVSAGDLGYIDSAGEFKTTTIAYSDVEWAVVLVGGANNADIYVARRGEVMVTVDGNNNDGDFLYTSTTAGWATSLSYVRPEVFAVVKPGGANAAGAGGTCSALLLCQRTLHKLSSTNDVLRIDSSSSSGWSATQSGAPAGATVTYNTPLVSGNEDSIVPVASTQLGKLLLHNTTRGETAYISAVNTAANTITVTAAGDVAAWQNGDSLQVISTTITGVGMAYFDLEVTSNEIPALAISLLIESTIIDNGGAARSYLHPYETYSASKEQQTRNGDTGTINRPLTAFLANRRFGYALIASGAATATVVWRVVGYEVAAP